jgi:chromosome segregation ATPase
MGSISSCSAPGVSAKDSNVFQAAGNLRTGEFNKQLQRKSLDLNASANNLNNEKNKQASLQATLNNQRKELSKIKSELAKIEQENIQLDLKISQLKDDSKQQKYKKSKALKKLAGIKKNTKVIRTVIIKTVPSRQKQVSSSSNNNKKYRKQLAALNKEVKVLREMLIND